MTGGACECGAVWQRSLRRGTGAGGSGVPLYRTEMEKCRGRVNTLRKKLDVSTEEASGLKEANKVMHEQVGVLAA